jgi:hypothetical protein
MRKRMVEVNDMMQVGYCYTLTEPMGRNFDPEFKPELTPKQMLRLGVFGGKYMTDTTNEFPREWFAGAKLSQQGRDPSLNCFCIDAGQPLSIWREQGWIRPGDPRGGFSGIVILLWPPHARARSVANRALESNAAPHSASPEELRTLRSWLPPPAATGPSTVGLRQPKNLTRRKTMATLFSEQPPAFLARTAHSDHDIAVIRDELRSAGFAQIAIETERTSRAPSHRDPAIGSARARRFAMRSRREVQAGSRRSPRPLLTPCGNASAKDRSTARVRRM